MLFKNRYNLAKNKRTKLIKESEISFFQTWIKLIVLK